MMSITREQLQKQIEKDRKDFLELSVNLREAVVAEMTGIWVTHLWDKVISETAEERKAAEKVTAGGGTGSKSKKISTFPS